ncbi:dethiobiotin synthase [Clostridium formicaceticum]|uniref:ATP-dependent dethiobiotin synthetase BioD n=1 Tax=Clostridium formicaceticum TaxID=1497 RepID=A0AAC9RH82_9CLOT|nr:dethiobiotin synthase [Clostridium formicaceticum]AOY76534.1 dethiobiotin synthase [Clostridium formicaceticum]ARE86946.1 ATP-dependent dethiobiotin synthetase BioD 1 [Clostridium formicaceticum]
MGKGLFIVGTDTDVGKTFVTAGMTYLLRKDSFKAISFKPVQSGGILKNEKLVPTDVAFVREIAAINEEDVVMNSYCLREAVSPHIAAEKENVKIDIQKIIDDYEKLKAVYDYVLVEGAGGVVVPLIRDGYYIYDLIRELDIPAVIVARAGVGTINHTALTADFLRRLGVEVRGFIINQYHGSYYEKDNIEVIKKITGLNAVAIIHKIDLKEEREAVINVRETFERSLTVEGVLDLFD